MHFSLTLWIWLRFVKDRGVHEENNRTEETRSSSLMQGAVSSSNLCLFLRCLRDSSFRLATFLGKVFSFSTLRKLELNLEEMVAVDSSITVKAFSSWGNNLINQLRWAAYLKDYCMLVSVNEMPGRKCYFSSEAKVPKWRLISSHRYQLQICEFNIGSNLLLGSIQTTGLWWWVQPRKFNVTLNCLITAFLKALLATLILLSSPSIRGRPRWLTSEEICCSPDFYYILIRA